ncbi:MAG: hypothetical protein FWE19_08705 [Oscillospiraceae bacterium]|nr:hypothetical protein [Oscillospiraceae bacterium]
MDFEPLATCKLTQPLCELGFRVRNSRGEVFAANCAVTDEHVGCGAASSVRKSTVPTNLPLTY